MQSAYKIFGDKKMKYPIYNFDDDDDDNSGGIPGSPSPLPW